MVPILMCIVCGVYCYRKKAMKEDPNWKMTLPRSRSGSRATLRHLNSDGSEVDQDTLKKSRSYDKVYRTNEPLEGKPNIDFPEKKWDLEDEDVTSSDGSEFPKIASDIEYVSQKQPEKQLGRRNERLGFGGIEEEEQNYPPPPLDSPSPVNYSPTYSGLDRDSSFMSDPPNNATRPPTGAVRVFPNTNTGYYAPGPSSPTSVSSPTPTQELGLPKLNRSTDV